MSERPPRWTEGEKARLREMWRNGDSLTDIARAVKRTPHACSAQAGYLRLPPRVVNVRTRRTD